MYSISEIAKLTQVTPRTLRHYEQKGLLSPSHRGNNGYRYYSEEVIQRITEIKYYQKMEFSLEQIKSILSAGEENLGLVLKDKFEAQLKNVQIEIEKLKVSEAQIKDQLLATNNLIKGVELDTGQRRILMESMKSEVLHQLKLKKEVTNADLEYLKREDHLFDSKDKREFFSAIVKCMEFAKKEGIKIGPARGASPACLSLYALGWSNIDPTEYNLMPERYSPENFDLHVDVEFANGRKFIDFCRKISADLKVGNIEAFKLPILDIIDKVHERLGKVINYDEIDDNDPVVLDVFRKGDAEKIFGFDFPADTLLAKHFDFYYQDHEKSLQDTKEYLLSQPINDMTDLINICSVFRPYNLSTKPFFKEYMSRYVEAKKKRHYYDCLTPALNEYLNPNYGVIIYQEDINKIIQEYTGRNLVDCNEFRRKILHKTFTEDEKNNFVKLAGNEVFELLERETPVVFCKSHSFGGWHKVTKITAVLKSLHKDIYYEEISKWEAENGYSWGDFGFINNEMSLLQQ